MSRTQTYRAVELAHLAPVPKPAKRRWSFAGLGIVAILAVALYAASRPSVALPVVVGDLHRLGAAASTESELAETESDRMGNPVHVAIYGSDPDGYAELMIKVYEGIRAHSLRGFVLAMGGARADPLFRSSQGRTGGSTVHIRCRMGTPPPFDWFCVLTDGDVWMSTMVTGTHREATRASIEALRATHAPAWRHVLGDLFGSHVAGPPEAVLASLP